MDGNRRPRPEAGAATSSVAWPALWFSTSRLPGVSMEPLALCGYPKQGCLNACNTTHCSNRMRRVVWHPTPRQLRAGASHPTAPLTSVLREEKKRDVAPAPICGQQIGQMRA